MKLPNIPLVQTSLNLSEFILPSELIELNLNDKQTEYLVGLKTYYLVKIGSLYAVLNGYSRVTFVRDYLEVEYTDFLDRELELELMLYELLKYSWKSISFVFIPCNITNPEAAMQQLYHFEAIHTFSQCLAVTSKICTSALYREYSPLDAIKNDIKLNKKLTKLQKKLVKKVRNRYLADETKQLAIHFILIEICEEIWSKSNDVEIKTRYKNYQKEKIALNIEVKKPLNPRNNPKPIGWIGGFPIDS